MSAELAPMIGFEENTPVYSVPERRMIAALLKRSIEDYALEEKAFARAVSVPTIQSRAKDLKAAGYHKTFDRHRKREALNTARSWIESTSRKDWSFIWCCGILELDPDKIRDSIKRQVLT